MPSRSLLVLRWRVLLFRKAGYWRPFGPVPPRSICCGRACRWQRRRFLPGRGFRQRLRFSRRQRGGLLLFRIRQKAVDHVKLDIGFGFAFEPALEQLVAVQVQGEDLLQSLGRLDLTGDVAVGFLWRNLSQLPEAIDYVGAGEGKGPGQVFARFLQHGFLFALEGLYDFGVFHQLVGGGPWVFVAGNAGGSDQIARPSGNKAELLLAQERCHLGGWRFRFLNTITVAFVA